MRNLFCTAAVLAEAEFTVSHIAAMISYAAGANEGTLLLQKVGTLQPDNDVANYSSWPLRTIVVRVADRSRRLRRARPMLAGSRLPDTIKAQAERLRRP